MVSTRPSPTPARGRVAYPSATNYTPGDAETSPTYLGSSPVRQVTSRDSDREGAQGPKTWWKGFRDRPEPQKNGSSLEQTVLRADGRGVFGVSLSRSIEYASVQISTANPEGELYVWGVIPVVVAKCGLYLKENGTEVEGTFRISGSAKRMRELQAIFDTGPKYGKNVDWKALSFTTHDVATIFRRWEHVWITADDRFLTQMPESIIPFDFYEDFRSTLSRGTAEEETISEYKSLIQALPAPNQYLLLYVLDLLSVFAKNSDVNLMTSANLALIFQPGILSHPIHAMRPRDHVLSQQVIEFLIEHQDHFLIGMELKPVPQARIEETSITGPASPPATSPVPSTPALPALPAPPPLVRADSDLMLPSDSDDDVPEGGYYVFEGKAMDEPVSPITPVSPPTSVASPPMTSLQANLLPKKPVKPPTGWPAQPPPKPVYETMEPSDSDDEAPAGGYEVRASDPKVRVALLARSTIRKTESRTTEVGSSVSRRKTVPSRRMGETSRPRRHAKEEP